jgi:hypothetical protein
MKEFAYIDSDGNVEVIFYMRDVAWIEDKIRKAADE